MKTSTGSPFSIDPLPVLIGSEWNSAAGYAAGLKAPLHDVTAVFCGNDELALGLLSAARKRGFDGPRDFEALGAGPFDMIHNRVDTGVRQEHFVLPAELVIRESTAPPRVRD